MRGAMLPRFFLAALISVIYLTPAWGQDTLRVLSWNIYMLPDPVYAKSRKIRRARHIADMLMQREQYDVVVFQEAFHGGVRRVLRKALKEKYPYEKGPANFRPWHIKTSSGVWILSRTPLTELKEHQYTECEGASDCMARKGVLAVETEWKGRRVQILGTHIQAGDKKGRPVKEAQYNEFGRIITELYNGGVPQVVCGDFNMRRSRSDRYDNMLSALCVDDYCLYDVDYTVHGMNGFRKRPGYQNEIDYIFFRHNGAVPESITRRTRIFQSDWSRDNKDLSDHYAVEAVIVY